MDTSPNLLEILRETLADTEKALALASGDPHLRQLMQAFVRTIAEIDLKRTQVQIGSGWSASRTTGA